MRVRIRHIVFASACLLLITGGLEAKKPVMTPQDTPVVGPWDHALVNELYRDIAGQNPDAGLKAFRETERFQELMQEEPLELLGGPMLGCVTPNSARIWVRTNGPATVRAVVSEDGTFRDPLRSDPVKTSAQDDFTALLEVSGLEPFSDYHYDILLDGESMLDGSEPTCPERPSFRTYPEKGQKVRFSVAYGGGARYIPEKEHMWDVIASRSPTAFLFLGDNVYIDEPHNRTKQRVMYYRRQLRPEYRRLTASTSMYAIWDDHDFGDNDCAGGLDPFKPEWKVPAWRVFKENWNNPYYGGGEDQPGCWFDFSIGDVDFFMTDGRYYRDFGEGTMLGPAQKEWLKRRLKASDATFKLIVSPVEWTKYADKGGGDSWWGVPEEREEIFTCIDDNNIGGVVLLSADRHRTDIFKMERDVGYPLYEFETSKLTNNHTHGTKDKAVFSYNDGNFYGRLTFDFTRADPVFTFRCITDNDETVHKMTLSRSQLQPE